MHPRDENGKFTHGRYIAVATVRYSAIDEDGVDGTLIYLKPGLYDEAYFPEDVYSYAQQSPTFPQETTGNQFFTESQFESYRELGRHVINEICGFYPEATKLSDRWLPAAKQCKTVADFVDAVRDRLDEEGVAGGMEVTTTDGEKTIAHAMGDGVRIRLRPQP